MDLRGLGGPGSGYLTLPQGYRQQHAAPFGDLAAWWAARMAPYGGADGSGMGPFGYGRTYNIPWYGEQALMLDGQWGWGGNRFVEQDYGGRHLRRR